MSNLELPKPLFGVEPAKRTGREIAILTIVPIAFAAFVLYAFHAPDETWSMVLGNRTEISWREISLAGSAILFFPLGIWLLMVSGAVDDRTNQAVAQAEKDYARNVFKPWLESKYGVIIGDDAAFSLMRGFEVSLPQNAGGVRKFVDATFRSNLNEARWPDGGRVGPASGFKLMIAHRPERTFYTEYVANVDAEEAHRA